MKAEGFERVRSSRGTRSSCSRVSWTSSVSSWPFGVLQDRIVPGWAAFLKSTQWAQPWAVFSHPPGGKQSTYRRAEVALKGKALLRGKNPPPEGGLTPPRGGFLFEARACVRFQPLGPTVARRPLNPVLPSDQEMDRILSQQRFPTLASRPQIRMKEEWNGIPGVQGTVDDAVGCGAHQVVRP